MSEENWKNGNCEDCKNVDLLKLQFRGMLVPLEKTIDVLAERWKSFGLWSKILGSIITLLLGWGVMVLGDLNKTLRDFGIIAHQNKIQIQDHKDSNVREYLDLSGRIEDEKAINQRQGAWLKIIDDRVIKLEKEHQ